MLCGWVEFTYAIAIRGSVNTGFRAPTPGQSNVSSTFSNTDAITGAPFITGIVSPSNPVAQLFGAQPLDREKSFNIAAGIVLTPARRLTFTRSEEHTSELQSLMRISYAVFCLKKKKTITINTPHPRLKTM